MSGCAAPDRSLRPTATATGCPGSSAATWRHGVRCSPTARVCQRSCALTPTARRDRSPLARGPRVHRAAEFEGAARGREVALLGFWVAQVADDGEAAGGQEGLDLGGIEA